MRARSLALICALMTFGQAVPAQTPPSAQVLATAQASIEFCSRLKPADAKQYRQRERAMDRSVPARDLARLRGSDEYKTTYASAQSALARLTAEEAEAACRGLLDVRSNN